MEMEMGMEMEVEKTDALDVANPSADAAPTRAAVEAALAQEPANATLKLVDSYYASELQKMRDEIELQKRSGDAAVMSVFARLTEAPTNWHQATVFALSSDDPQDAALRARAPWMFAVGCFIVALQCFTMPRLFVGSLAEICVTQDDCSVKGMFCGVGKKGIGGTGSAQCSYCATHAPLEHQWEYVDGKLRTFNFPEDQQHRVEPFSKFGFNRTHVLEVCKDPTRSHSADPAPGYGGHPWPAAYRCYDEVGEEPPWERVPTVCPGATELGEPSPGYREFVGAWCHACVDTFSGDVNELTGWLLPANHVAAMSKADWIAYILCALVVTLTMVAELKDIVLVRMTIQEAGNKLSPKWRLALTVLNGIRRWVFMPGLMVTVIALVVFTGGLALNTCFSTVAILFITDIDNLMFFTGFEEKVRAHVEFAGRIHLDEDMAAELWWTKKIFMALMPFAMVLAPMPMATRVQSDYIKGWMIAIFTYIVTQGVAEFGLRPSPVAVLKVVGKTILGFIGLGISMVPSFL